jgi:hypothetical protein
MYGHRPCCALSPTISDDEGDSWRYIDVPGSSLPPFILGNFTYLLSGNAVDQPIQANMDEVWDQGYDDPLYDLVEFSDVKRAPDGRN